MDNPVSILWTKNTVVVSVSVCQSAYSVSNEPFDLSPKEAAELVGVHEYTLKRWAADGKVRAFRTPGGWWRFRSSDIDALLAPAELEPETEPAA